MVSLVFITKTEWKRLKMFFRYAPLLRTGLTNPSLFRLILKLKREKKTYLTYATLPALAENVQQVYRRFQTPLNIAEFGVGRGGSAILLAWLVKKYGGRLSLYDVFERIPPPSEVDGQRATERYNYILNQEGKDYYGNIESLLEIIKNDLQKVCDLSQIEFIRGRYEDTLRISPDNKFLHFVHIDCDWYESSKFVLSYLKSTLHPAAILQIDDYSNWQGSRKAFEEASWLHPYRKKVIDGALVVDTALYE